MGHLRRLGDLLPDIILNPTPSPGLGIQFGLAFGFAQGLRFDPYIDVSMKFAGDPQFEEHGLPAPLGNGFPSPRR